MRSTAASLVFLAASALAGAAWGYFRAERGPASRPSARSAEEILAEHRAVKTPRNSFGMTKEEFETKLGAGVARQGALASELLAGHPEHPEVPRLMQTRWAGLVNFFERPEEVLREAGAVIESGKPPALVPIARLAVANASLAAASLPTEVRVRRVEEALAANGGDVASAAYLLSELATRYVAEPERQRALLERARSGSADMRSASQIGEYLALHRGLGETLALSFRDARSGADVSLESLRGRPVLVYVAALDREAEEPMARALAGLAPRLAAARAAVVTVPLGLRQTEAARLVEIADRLGVPGSLFAETTPLTETWAWKLGARGTPLFLLLDEEGRLRAVSARAAPLVELLESPR